MYHSEPGRIEKFFMSTLITLSAIVIGSGLLFFLIAIILFMLGIDGKPIVCWLNNLDTAYPGIYIRMWLWGAVAIGLATAFWPDSDRKPKTSKKSVDTADDIIRSVKG